MGHLKKENRFLTLGCFDVQFFGQQPSFGVEKWEKWLGGGGICGDFAVFFCHVELLGYESDPSLPIGSMYGIFTYIWVIYRANVSKYSIHGASGLDHF